MRAKLLGGSARLLAASLLLLVACRAATSPAPAALAQPAPERLLDLVQERTFHYFWQLSNPENGLVPDRAPTPSFSSVAAVGFGLTAYPVGAERGYITREEARRRVLTTLRFLASAPQGPSSRGVTGYKGFFYHFLNMESGERFEQVELSTIDTALLMAGVLMCHSYFDGENPEETEVRSLADTLYRRVEWDWAQPNPPLVNHGWKPEGGFLPHDWGGGGYDEAMILYVLALGSPTHPIPEDAWAKMAESFRWGTFHGQEYIQFGPLFGYQYSQTWVDFRGIRDAPMRARGLDYFENSRRATLAHRAYAIANPMGWKDYGEKIWGVTACDGPADVTLSVNSEPRRFWSYAGRGVSRERSFDDGTIAPTGAGASVAFAPEIAIPALEEMMRRYGEDLFSTYGFLDAFNPTFTFTDVTLQHGRVVPGKGWFDTDYLGIDQGPILAMIENYRSGLVWETMKKNPYIVRGLQRAGFTGGWLEALERVPPGRRARQPRAVPARPPGAASPASLP